MPRAHAAGFGFSMDASAIDRFDVIVQNGAPGAGQMLDYSRVDLYDQLSVDPWMFNALLVTWVDPAGLALSSTAWPTSVEGFRVTELRFNGFRGHLGICLPAFRHHVIEFLVS